MKVPFLDLQANYQSVKDDVLKAIHNVLDSSQYILGPHVEAFEKRFAAHHEAQHCLGVSSGTDGNHLALWSLGLESGDEVIMPANTFVATAWGATLCGATPVFVDVDPKTYTIDPVKVVEAITPKTKAIVAVHLYGQPADMDALRDIARRHDLWLVEDCAQAHIALYKGKPVGTLGHVSSFSFYPGKNLGAYGEGGAVMTNDDLLANQMRMYRDHGQIKKYHHSSFGHNYRMDGIQGAVLGTKLEHLEKWTAKRRSVAEQYESLLEDVEEITLPFEAEYSNHVYHLYVIKSNDRDQLQAHLTEHGIGTGLHYPVPLHLQDCFAHLEYERGSMPVTEELARMCLSLPIFPEMTTEQVMNVANCIRDFYGKPTHESSIDTLTNLYGIRAVVSESQRVNQERKVSNTEVI